MSSPETTARPSRDLETTDELPALDVAAFETEDLGREPAAAPDDGASATGPESPAAGAPEAPGAPAVPVPDPDVMLAVEHWIVQKAEELRAHQAREREAAQRRASELDEAQREATRLREELSVARSAEAQRSTALAASAALVEQRSDALDKLQRDHQALVADRQRAARELTELESRLRESETRERNAHSTIEAQKHTEAELVHRAQHGADAYERLTAEREVLKAQLASYIEGLHNRESYRSIFESSAQELDAELASATLRAEAQEARANQLAAELQAYEQRLRDAVQQRDEARERLGALEAEIALRQAELAEVRVESERDRVALADLTATAERSQTALADLNRLLAERESAAQTLASAHSEQTALSATLRGQIEELSARLATPEAERRALEERVAALTQEVAERDSRLARLESMNVELRATVGQLHSSLAERDAELQRATRTASTNAYALGRVQSSIDELGRGLTASEGALAQTQASILTRIDGGHNHSMVLRGRTTIGRDPDNDLSLAMASVSRRHALLVPGFRGALVQDLGSTNGVLVNRRRVRCARLQHGDLITLGMAQFRYTVAPAPAGHA
jgi:septal ring factor EnvC (AmiA/AmiB activator)